jgi:hypothetical protein
LGVLEPEVVWSSLIQNRRTRAIVYYTERELRRLLDGIFQEYRWRMFGGCASNQRKSTSGALVISVVFISVTVTNSRIKKGLWDFLEKFPEVSSMDL